MDVFTECVYSPCKQTILPSDCGRYDNITIYKTPFPPFFIHAVRVASLSSVFIVWWHHFFAQSRLYLGSDYTCRVRIVQCSPAK